MKNIRGFTLIEGILSIAILSAGAVTLLYAFQGSVSASLSADQTVMATNIARDTMERIVAQRDCNETGCGYSATLTSINTTGTYDANPVSGFAGFVLDSSATEVNPDDDNNVDDFLDAQAGSGYARVNVRVSWNNNTDYIQLVTLIASY